MRQMNYTTLANCSLLTCLSLATSVCSSGEKGVSVTEVNGATKDLAWWPHDVNTEEIPNPSSDRASSDIKTNQSSKASPLKKTSRRLFEFAQRAYPRREMQMEEWLWLLDHNDERAIQVQKLYKAKLSRYNLQTRLRRKLEDNIQDEEAIMRMQMCGIDREELVQKITAARCRVKMDKSKRDIIGTLVNRFRKELDHFQKEGVLAKYVPYTSDVLSRAKGTPGKSDGCEEGNREGDRIIRKLRGASRLFHLAPFHPYLRVLVEELNEWMQLNRSVKTVFVLPRGGCHAEEMETYDSRAVNDLIRQIQNEEEISQIQVNSAHVEEVNAPLSTAEIQRRYPTREQQDEFIQSLFEYQEDAE